MIYKRKIADKIIKSLSEPEIIFILGTRRAGKTTLAKYIGSKFNGKVKYVDLEFSENVKAFEMLTQSQSLLKNILKIYGLDDAHNILLILDEVQYLSDPTKTLKILHDHVPNLKIIATGSSSLQIKQKFRDSLAGRKQVFVLHPLDFDEFLEFKQQQTLLELRNNFDYQKLAEFQKLIDIYKIEFSQLLAEFIIFGGYPEVVLADEKEIKIEKLQNIVESYITMDIRQLTHIVNVESFNDFIKYLSINTGNLFNISSAASDLNISMQTVKRFLFLLEETYIIHSLSPFYANKNLEIVKNKKIYFYDTGVRNLQLLNFFDIENRADKGALYETFVFAQLYKGLKLTEKLYFYRTKHKAEIDFLKLQQNNVILYEVKFSNQKTKSRAIAEFYERYKNQFDSIFKVIVNKNLLQLRDDFLFLPHYFVK